MGMDIGNPPEARPPPALSPVGPDHLDVLEPERGHGEHRGVPRADVIQDFGLAGRDGWVVEVLDRSCFRVGRIDGAIATGLVHRRRNRRRCDVSAVQQVSPLQQASSIEQLFARPVALLLLSA